MNIIRNLATTTAMVLSLGLALPAAAQGAYGAVDSTTQGQGTVDLGTARVGAEADVDVKVDASVETSSDSDSNSSDVRVQSADVNGDGQADITGDPDFDLLRITRVDVDAGTVGSSSVTPANVKTQADLSGFVAAQMKNDANISAVEAASESVAVTYKQRAKLFGFIPITLDATATVNADGRTKVSYPWYAFLAVTNKTDLESKIEAQAKVITAREAGSGMATGRVATGDVDGDGVEASVKLSADVQAKLIAAVQATLQSEFNADANARVNKVDSFTVKQ